MIALWSFGALFIAYPAASYGVYSYREPSSSKGFRIWRPKLCSSCVPLILNSLAPVTFAIFQIAAGVAFIFFITLSYVYYM